MARGPNTAQNGQIQRSSGNGAATNLKSLIAKMAPQIARAVPKHIDPERMARIATTAISTTPDLAECSVPSFLGSLLTSAQLGLEPNTPLGHCYLIPRWNKHTRSKEATFLLGYQGMIELVRRSGQVRSLYAHAVFEGDEFQFAYGLDPELKHVPCGETDPGKILAVYAVAHLGEGGHDRQFIVLQRRQIDAARARGGDRKFSPWVSDYQAMAEKTAIRRLFKYLPKTAELARAIDLDVRAETGRPQAPAYDEEVADNLLREGHTLLADAVEVEDAELVTDPETGEVTEEAVPLEYLARLENADSLWRWVQNNADYLRGEEADWSAVTQHARRLGVDPREIEARLNEGEA